MNGFATIPTTTVERPPSGPFAPSKDDTVVDPLVDGTAGRQRTSNTHRAAGDRVPNSSAIADRHERTPRPNQAWRVALNFNRNIQGTSLNPLDGFLGASRGVQFPVVVPAVDFTNTGLAIPRNDYVSYTDVKGGVTRPVEGGTWTAAPVAGDGTEGQHSLPPLSRPFQFTLRFPEELRRGDIGLPADTTVILEGLLYSQNALKRLNEEFIAARKKEWEAEELLEGLYKERDGPKKWNPDTNQWERPTLDVPLTTLVAKHWAVFTKKQERQRKNGQRPKSSDMSKQAGRFPGLDDDDRVHMGSFGIIRIANNSDYGRNAGVGGTVIGSWSAEPVTEMPYLSYYDAGRRR